MSTRVKRPRDSTHDWISTWARQRIFSETVTVPPPKRLKQSKVTTAEGVPNPYVPVRSVAEMEKLPPLSRKVALAIQQQRIEAHRLNDKLDVEAAEQLQAHEFKFQYEHGMWPPEFASHKAIWQEFFQQQRAISAGSAEKRQDVAVSTSACRWTSRLLSQVLDEADIDKYKPGLRRVPPQLLDSIRHRIRTGLSAVQGCHVPAADSEETGLNCLLTDRHHQADAATWKEVTSPSSIAQSPNIAENVAGSVRRRFLVCLLMPSCCQFAKLQA